MQVRMQRRIKKPQGLGSEVELKQPARSDDDKIEAIHKTQVQKLKKTLGNIPLSDTTLKRLGKKLFGSKFIGVKMQNEAFPNKSGYGIMNTDVKGGRGLHWLAVVKMGTQTYVYDSFGRQAKNIVPKFTKRVGRGVQNADTSDQDQHGYTSVDCGHRCISALMIADKMGTSAFMQL